MSKGEAADDPQDDDGGAAQAFAELRAEVSEMRRAMEKLPAVLKSLAAPDYAPSFGAVGKTLASVDARLAGVEGHPALRMTPDQHAGAMKRAGIEVMSDAARSLRNEADAVGREQQKLAQIVGESLGQEAQKRALYWALGAGVAIGFVLFPLLGAFAPGGSFLAAFATGNFDRWYAGGGLMQAGSPDGWREFVRSDSLVRANADALKACRDLAAKAGKEQKCTISVQATGQ